MLKLNKLADYATVVLTALATAPTRLLNGQALSAQTQIPAPTVAKVLKALTRGGLVTSSRGPHGGYQLAHAPEAITVSDVVSNADAGTFTIVFTSGAAGIELQPVMQDGQLTFQARSIPRFSWIITEWM